MTFPLELHESIGRGIMPLSCALRELGFFNPSARDEAAEAIVVELAKGGTFLAYAAAVPGPDQPKPSAPPPNPVEVAAVARAIMLQNASKRTPEKLGGLTPEYVADHGWPKLAGIADCAIRALDKVRAEKS